MSKTITTVQAAYIWLMGSHPKLVAKQGRGYRGRPIRYAVDEGTLYLFGYSNPLFFLEVRKLVRRLEQDGRLFVLTEAGEAQFNRLVAVQAGFRLNPLVQEATLKK